MQNPFEVTIQNQAEDEEIVRIWRHHPITLVGPVLKVLAFAIIPIALLFITGLSMLASPFLFVLYLVILALVATYAAYEWISWWGDVYILTNYRIIDVEQRGFFHRKFAEATLGKIQDVSHEVSGVFATLFNFGTVLVQTAGSLPNIDLNDIAKPQQQALFLLKAQQAYLEDEDHDLTAKELIELLGKHRRDLEKIARADKEMRQAEVQRKMDEVKKRKK
ncbi:MAG: hypothetical protein WD603_00925 [Patescibacteria group bacterium]